MGVSRWNGVAILSRSQDIRITSLLAAILDFRLPVTSDSIRNSAIEFLDPENRGVAVGIFILSIIEPEIPWGVILPPNSNMRVKTKPRNALLRENFRLCHCTSIKIIASALSRYIMIGSLYRPRQLNSIIHS